METRQYKRFKAMDGALAVFSSTLQPNLPKLGRLLDISAGGLAFSYTARGIQTEGASSLRISWHDDEMSTIEGIPFKIVYDVDLSGHYRLGLPEDRRCGVQFGDLSAEQSKQLVAFIRNYSRGEIAG